MLRKKLFFILLWIAILLGVFLIMSFDYSFAENSEKLMVQDIDLKPDFTPSKNKDHTNTISTDYIIKTFIAVSILIIGYFASLGIKSVLNKLEHISAIEKSLEDTINRLIVQTKYLRENDKAIQKDLDIVKRKINKHQDWINKHNIVHAKYGTDEDFNTIEPD